MAECAVDERDGWSVSGVGETGSGPVDQFRVDVDAGHAIRAESGAEQRIHTLYGTDDQLNNDDIDVAALQPRMVRTESTGDFYTMIHSVTAQPYTTSLIIRGPALKDRFLVTDRRTGRAWWQYGAATEPPDEAARKRMNPTQANACLRQLTELRVLN